MAIYTGVTKVAGGGTPMITLTKAEYDALTPTQKLGNIYMTTDEVESGAVATALSNGLMSNTDKVILDGASAPITYAPTITASSGTFTTVSATAKYVKIGKQVTITFDITITAVGTASGNLYFSLPFTASGNGFGSARERLATGVMCSVFCYDTSVGATITRYDNTSIIASGRAVMGVLTYFTA